MKLLTEVAHALLYGLKTTSRRDLDRLYEAKDEEFPEQEQLGAWIEGALNAVSTIEAVHETGIAKPYSVYSLVLALAHASADVPALRSEGVGGTGIASARDIDASLGVLADALEEKAVSGRYGKFVRASTDRTNVVTQRRTRFKTYLAAVRA